MAILTDPERDAIWDFLMIRWGNPASKQTTTITKTEFQDAIHDVDDNITMVGGTDIDLWFPEPARSDLTENQKSEVLVFIFLRRMLNAGFPQ